MIWPSQAVQAAGYEVAAFLPETDGAHIQSICYRDDDGQEQLQDVLDPKCDVVVLQRPLQRLLADAIPKLKRWGVKVVVEVDDDFQSIHPQNVAYSPTHPATSPDRNRDHLMRACQMADRVTVTTPDLLQRYGFGKGVVIPNYVPQWYTTIAKVKHDPVRIGWSGNIDTHPWDLQEMGSTLPLALRRGYQLFVVGSGKGVARRAGLGKAEFMTCGWVPIDEYPVMMAEIDIGVVPLQLQAFNHAKSWLKGLEFAAVGVPFVASPTRPYVELMQRYGIGTVAERPKDWLRMIQRMAPDREELGEQCRNLVIDKGLTIESRWSLWADAWTKW